MEKSSVTSGDFTNSYNFLTESKIKTLKNPVKLALENRESNNYPEYCKPNSAILVGNFTQRDEKYKNAKGTYVGVAPSHFTVRLLTHVLCKLTHFFSTHS